MIIYYFIIFVSLGYKNDVVEEKTVFPELIQNAQKNGGVLLGDGINGFDLHENFQKPVLKASRQYINDIVFPLEVISQVAGANDHFGGNSVHRRTVHALLIKKG